MRETDVFVCGGGPAGLAAAISAGQRGFSVVVADFYRPPIDKACGEGLMPDSQQALAKLGVSLDGCEMGSFDGIRFVDRKGAVEACFPEGKGLGIRRLLLHDAMHRRAVEVGVEFRWGKKVLGAVDGVVELGAGAGVEGGVRAEAGSEQIKARWVVGADGMNSRVRRWAGLDAGRRLSARIGLRQHYAVTPWSRFMEIHWAPLGQAYVTPISANEVCVVFMLKRRFGSLAEALKLFPELDERLAGAASDIGQRGALTVGHVYDRVTDGRTALVGDASGSIDAIGGEGLSLSFRQAEALAEAMERGDLMGYDAAHRAIRRVPKFVSQSMLLMDRYDMVRRRSIASLHRNPRLLASMLAVHVGASPLKMLGRGGVLNMGMRMLGA